MLKCKYEYCQYPNCDGENCGVSIENLLAYMCAEARHWRETTEQMYHTAMTTPIQILQRELNRLRPQQYTPTCPFGYNDCISDPAYIRTYHPEWWIELGRPTQCGSEYNQEEADAMGWCQYYDDEDK